MTNKNRLNQVTCIERLDDNAVYFDKLTKNIQCGRADEAVRDMVGWNAVSDLDPFDYDEILDHARRLNERIVYDDGEYLLAGNNSMIILYKYFNYDISDKLGNKINIGDKVLWIDPNKSTRDLNRVWRIFDIQSEESVKIEDIYSEGEVTPSELILASAILD